MLTSRKAGMNKNRWEKNNSLDLNLILMDYKKLIFDI